MKASPKFTAAVALLLFSTIQLAAQNMFRYQAVARDSSGAPISNQTIGAQISIIEIDSTNAPVYTETHLTESNSYGVINLNVGDGLPLTGNFNLIDWSLTSFIKVEMDITGGSNYELSSLAEILPVPKALYAEKSSAIAGTGFGLIVTNFGAKGDGTTDDTDAFNDAIDSAAITGAKIFIPAGIYRITQSLVLPDGVAMIGEGIGSNPLETPFNGSVLKCESGDYAVKITGHAAGLRDLIIRDNSGSTASGGIMIEADGRLVENTFISNVLISNYTGGTGLILKAVNSGGIAYSDIKNIRIRHAMTGLHIVPDASSFINANSFYQGAISGGGFDYGIRIEGGNNTFIGTVVEPPLSANGHIVVTGGQITARDIWVEGVQQDPLTPLIVFETGTINSVLAGHNSGGLTLDKGNNYIDMKSGKAIHYRNASYNRFKNASFQSVDGISPGAWSISGSGVTTEVIAPELVPRHQVLKITVPAGIIAEIEPSALMVPESEDLPLYSQVNFGFHVKTSTPEVAYTLTNAPAGWTISHAHSGSGDWEFVGMNAAVSQTQTPVFQLRIENTTGTTIEAYVTTPTLSFGNELPQLDAAPLSSSGGTLYGLLSHSMASATVPSNGFLSLPRSANYFSISNTNTIARINHTTADRFPKGSVVTLLFDQSGTNVTNSAYLNLKSGFTSVANGSISLISLGNGTWREVDRNN